MGLFYYPRVMRRITIALIDINPTNKDLFALNDYIETEKTKVLYTPKSEECPPNDPFNNWVS